MLTSIVNNQYVEYVLSVNKEWQSTGSYLDAAQIHTHNDTPPPLNPPPPTPQPPPPPTPRHTPQVPPPPPPPTHKIFAHPTSNVLLCNVYSVFILKINSTQSISNKYVPNKYQTGKPYTEKNNRQNGALS